MPEGPNLILVHVSKSRPSNKLAQDDYDVWDGSARVVGRIFRATAALPGQSWFWTITERALQRPTESGYAATREEAMAAFRQAWERQS
jgi:hypothetical protein